MNILKIAFFLPLLYCKNEILAQNINKEFEPVFEYYNLNNEKIATKFYLIRNDTDTINMIDENGLKQGRWLEPFIDSKKIKSDSFELYYFSNTNILNEKHKRVYFNSEVLQSYITRNLILNYTSGNIVFFEDNSCFDNVLLNNVRDSIKQNSFYVEKYWFGYLFGKYSKGKRVGNWKFIPLVDNNIINNIIPFDYNKTGGSIFNKKYVNNINYIEGEQFGNYVNNKREGLWKSKRNLSNLENNELFLDYENNYLKTLFKNNDSNLDTIFVIFNENNRTYIKGKSNLLIDISYLPCSLRGVGERFYFENHMYLKDNEW